MKADAPAARRPLRVLFLARLFGGLKQSLAEGEWEPAGVPAIYRLLEGLAADPEVELRTVFSLKEPDARFPRVSRRPIAPIGDAVILPYRNAGTGALRPLGTLATEIEQTARILALAARFRPDVVYATYASLQAAGLLARFGHKKVVLRLMGIVPHHHRIAAGAMPLLGWQLRAPFAHVVCSEDGSDPAVVLPKLLRPGTPWTVRLNGCDARRPGDAEVRAFRAEIGLGERPIVVFVGRLEPQKGCVAFVDAANALLARLPDCADFVVVGDGPLRGELEARVRGGGHSARIHLAGSQPHERAYRYIGASDIYVSINMYGNLSNANLEAITAGACMLFPSSDPAVPIDTVTDDLVPADVALRYDRNRLPDSLSETLATLLAAPEEIVRRRERTAALAARLISAWARTVQTDIDLLKSIAGSHGPLAARAGTH